MAEEFRGQYRWFSVDEYQDTNPLQQALLEAWLGERRDLAVVGDEDQTIYTFTGATSEYLTGFVRRFPEARWSGWRTTTGPAPRSLPWPTGCWPPPRVGGRTGASGWSPPGPRGRSRPWPPSRTPSGRPGRWSPRSPAWPGPGSARRRVLPANAQIPPLEEALAAAGIRYQVRGELFFRRTEVLRAIGVLRSRTARAAGGGLVDALEAIWFERFGFRRDEEPDGEEARQRHASLVTLLGIAERVGDEAGIAGFLEVAGGPGGRGDRGRGDLLTYHRAKGLEFDAVLLPAVEEGLLPIRQASTPAEVAEERRLLYVGLTRARVHLVSWAARRARPSGREQPRKPSRFLDDLVPPGSGRVRPRAVASGMTKTGRSSVPADGPWPSSCGPGGASGPRPTGCPPTWSSTTAPWPPSPSGSPAAAASCWPSRASAPTSSTSYGDELLALLTPAEGE